jgi:hypothetical protein
MSKHLNYLTTQMEEAHSARIMDICLLAAVDPSNNRLPQAFEIMKELDYPEICRMFSWGNPVEAKKIIDGLGDAENWLDLFFNRRMYGFLAVIEMPGHTDFRVDDAGDFAGCSLRSCFVTQRVIYAESIAELVNSTVRIGANHFHDQFDAWKAAQ